MGWFDEYVVRLILTEDGKREWSRVHRTDFPPRSCYLCDGPAFGEWGPDGYRPITFCIGMEDARRFYDKAEAKRYMRDVKKTLGYEFDAYYADVEYVPYKMDR